jgi:hypothetical protein
MGESGGRNFDNMTYNQQEKKKPAGVEIYFTSRQNKSMSKFTTPVILEKPGYCKWRVYESFEFYLQDDNSDVIKVPAGVVTDLASVPRIFWTFLPPDGRYAKAAIIHDYMYDNALWTKKEADLIFLDGMRVLGVPKWKRTVMYHAVRMFGKGRYAQNRTLPGV